MINQLQLFCKKKIDEQLLDLLFSSHKNAASNNNPASTAFAFAQGQLGASLESAIIASLNSIGGKHAPLLNVRLFWFKDLNTTIDFDWRDKLINRISSGLLIPGFGNAIHKSSIDPALNNLAIYIENEYPEYGCLIKESTKIVQQSKNIYPNIAFYSAIVSEIIELEIGCEPLLFLMSRLNVWVSAWLSGKQE